MELCRSLKARIDILSDEELQNFYSENIAVKEFDWTLTVKNLGPLAEDRKALA